MNVSGIQNTITWLRSTRVAHYARATRGLVGRYTAARRTFRGNQYVRIPRGTTRTVKRIR